MKRSVTMMMCEMCMGMMSMCMFRRMTAPLFLFCTAGPAGRRCRDKNSFPSTQVKHHFKGDCEHETQHFD